MALTRRMWVEVDGAMRGTMVVAIDPPLEPGEIEISFGLEDDLDSAIAAITATGDTPPSPLREIRESKSDEVALSALLSMAARRPT